MVIVCCQEKLLGHPLALCNILQILHSDRKETNWEHTVLLRLPVSCRLSYYAEDLCWVCVCHDYPLSTWKQLAMYQYFSKNWIELFIIICSKQHTVSSLHCISQIWQIICFHSACKVLSI